MITLDNHYKDPSDNTYRHYQYVLGNIAHISQSAATATHMPCQTKAHRTLERIVNHYQKTDDYGSRAITFAALLGVMDIDKRDQDQWLVDLQRTMNWLYANQEDAIQKHSHSNDKTHSVKMYQLSDYETILSRKIRPVTSVAPA